MTDSQISVVEFYKNGSAQKVLEKYEFSEEEVKCIKDAIRSSKMSTPRMKPLEQADTLLKEAVKTRKVVNGKQVKIPPGKMAKMDSDAIGSLVQKDSTSLYIIKKLPLLLILGIVTTLIIDNITRVEDKTFDLVSFEEAVKICKDQQMQLPISYEDFGNVLQQPTNRNEIGYWSYEKTIATLPGRRFKNDDQQKRLN